MTTMRMHCATLSALAAACMVLACEESPQNEAPPAPRTTAPDNTAVNSRDRGTGTTTPMDQGESESDRRITADIRKALTSASDFSTNAQNCKIVTLAGVVTLRGPVDSQAEKDRIGDIAKSTAGVTSVVNELEVRTP